MAYYARTNESLQEENIEDILEKGKKDRETRILKKMIFDLISLTGLEKIKLAFESTYLETEETIDIVMKYIRRTTNFEDEDDNPYLYLHRKVGFSDDFLISCGVNDPRFFEHLMLEEACKTLIMRALRYFGYEASMETDRNDFPSILSIGTNVGTFIHWNSTIVYGYLSTRRYDNDRMMENIYSLLPEGSNTDNIYFHGTSWENSIAMLDDIRPGNRYTDFGRYCHYVSDYLPTAINWSFHNDQPAVIVFRMEDNWINNIPRNRKRNFTHEGDELDQWKQFVFNSRRHIDNQYHYINGPILSNPRRLNSPDDAEFLRTGRIVPYQTAVRTRELYDEFRDHILCIIFFRHGTTLRDNGI